jgi:hypothetical protein
VRRPRSGGLLDGVRQLRIELRADRIAAVLLGGTGPVLEMVDRLDTAHSGYAWMQRVQASYPILTRIVATPLAA